jgi:hypothetical protein
LGNIEIDSHEDGFTFAIDISNTFLGHGFLDRWTELGVGDSETLAKRIGWCDVGGGSEVTR